VTLYLLIAVVAGYLLGALPFGYLVARAKGVNIFEVGSRNPGATNVRRVLGAGAGTAVLILDALKGSAAAGWPLVLRSVPKAEVLAIAGLVAAILGHSFSCFTGFRGGKSVATAAGGFAVLFPAGMGIAAIAFAATLALSRYVSLSSMMGAATLPIAAVALGRSAALIGVAVAIALFVIVRHHTNITRLLAGTESKIGRPSAAPPAAPR
jgi:glycerol-3-phosphate acyltransferase PlsY